MKNSRKKAQKAQNLIYTFFAAIIL